MNDNNYRTKMDIVCSCEVRDELHKGISIFNSTSKLSVPYWVEYASHGEVILNVQGRNRNPRASSQVLAYGDALEWAAAVLFTTWLHALCRPSSYRCHD